MTLLSGTGPVTWADHQTVATVRVEPSASPEGGEVKYYVVGEPIDGQREYLFQIAAKTLGNGNRYLEIFALNQGRLQPDGQRVVDTTLLNPGWILLLPDDANGPAVHHGVLPQVTATSAPPSARTALAKVTTEGVVRLLVLIAVLGLVAVAFRQLRRRTRSTGRQLSLAAASTRAVTATPGPARPLAIASSPAITSSPAVASSPATTSSPAIASPGANATASADVQAPVAANTLASSAPAPAVPSSGSKATGRVIGKVIRAAPTAAAPASAPTDRRDQGPLTALLHAEVTAGPDTVEVRLAGARVYGAIAYTWVDRGQQPPAGATQVAIGDDAYGTLYIDLAASPDVVTVTGSDEATRRLSAALARQLEQAGVKVSVIGDVLGSPPPPGVRDVGAISEIASADGGRRGGVEVVFSPPAGAGEAPLLRKLLVRAAPRTVFVVIGDVRRSRWALDILP